MNEGYCLPDNTPLIPCPDLSSNDGATQVAVAEDAATGRLYRQRLLFGGDTPKPERWELFTHEWRV